MLPARNIGYFRNLVGNRILKRKQLYADVFFRFGFWILFVSDLGVSQTEVMEM